MFTKHHLQNLMKICVEVFSDPKIPNMRLVFAQFNLGAQYPLRGNAFD